MRRDLALLVRPAAIPLLIYMYVCAQTWRADPAGQTMVTYHLSEPGVPSMPCPPIVYRGVN
jgi:hypothetical protein